MAKCLPPPERAVSASNAELKLLQRLEQQLSDEYTVLHSVAWISKPNGTGPRDGEADLLICHPRDGILVVEVKGGRVTLDYQTNEWISKDGSGKVHPIKNPFQQARRAKYALLEKLNEYPPWQRLRVGRVNLGHAAFFPDVGDAQKLRGPDAPTEIIGDREDMDALSTWVQQALAFWQASEKGESHPIGTSGVDTITQLFARVASTRPLLAARIQDEEDRHCQVNFFGARQCTDLRFQLAAADAMFHSTIAADRKHRIVFREIR